MKPKTTTELARMLLSVPEAPVLISDWKDFKLMAGMAHLDPDSPSLFAVLRIERVEP